MSMTKTLNDWLPFLEKEVELGNPYAMEISLGANAISIFKERKSANFLHVGKMENSISIWDTTGKPAIELSVNQVFDHNFISVSDKKGNVKWIAP